jgi:hypothetical protein
MNVRNILGAIMGITLVTTLSATTLMPQKQQQAVPSIQRASIILHSTSIPTRPHGRVWMKSSRFLTRVTIEGNEIL